MSYVCVRVCSNDLDDGDHGDGGDDGGGGVLGCDLSCEGSRVIDSAFPSPASSRVETKMTLNYHRESVASDYRP